MSVPGQSAPVLDDRRVLSRHFFKRTAKAFAEARAEHGTQDHEFVVEQATRGPYRWYVVRYRRVA